jgi:hypothetical protein
LRDYLSQIKQQNADKRIFPDLSRNFRGRLFESGSVREFVADESNRSKSLAFIPDFFVASSRFDKPPPPAWTRISQLRDARNKLISLDIFCAFDRLLSKNLN